jgi:hypothetical protein
MHISVVEPPGRLAARALWNLVSRMQRDPPAHVACVKVGNFTVNPVFPVFSGNGGRVPQRTDIRKSLVDRDLRLAAAIVGCDDFHHQGSRGDVSLLCPS